MDSVVDEGKFRLMPRVGAPFVRVCVLSVVGGAGVGKFWMFSLFSHLTVLLEHTPTRVLVQYRYSYCTVRCGAPT